MTGTRLPLPRLQLTTALVAIVLLGACDDLDFDMRGRMGGPVDTAEAARTATARRPEPDSRGIISYPNYQVAVARRGDTLTSLAQRIGANAGELARYNGIKADDTLRAGEVIALPRRVAEPAAGPIRSPGSDITEIAGAAIDRADAPAVQTTTLAPSQPGGRSAGQAGVEPVRHQVERGETAFTIARLYGVSVRSLADWNGLGQDFSVRQGQFLLIPVATGPEDDGEAQVEEAAVSAPGEASPLPAPPSSTQPMPEEVTEPASKPAPTPPSPDLGSQQTASSTASGRMSMPVNGSIIREYSKGKTDGIDISASPGTAVSAAASGKVGAITEDASGKSIVVIKHPDGLLTVYANVAGIAVAKNDSVSRGQKIAEVGPGNPAYVRFGVYKGSDSVDPEPYLN